LRKYKTVIFVNGCFWHGHGCRLSKLPETRTRFWNSKIESTRSRDNYARKELKRLGWRSIIVWECALRGRRKLGLDVLSDCLTKFIRESRNMYSTLGIRQAR
jgi:DNA mismatch endonuclease (patch repair protein)